MERIGTKIQLYRKKSGYTQEKLSELLGLSTSYISAIERGKKIPKLKTFVNIANTLHVSADDLLDNELKTNMEAKASVLYDQIKNLPEKEQSKILHILNIMLGNINDEIE